MFHIVLLSVYTAPLARLHGIFNITNISDTKIVQTYLFIRSIFYPVLARSEDAAGLLVWAKALCIHFG